jgi:hypothetical protein
MIDGAPLNKAENAPHIIATCEICKQKKAVLMKERVCLACFSQMPIEANQ